MLIFVGLICLSCHRSANITDCLKQKVSCDTDEQCFLDTTILPDLSTVFSAGCISKQIICNLIASAVGKRDTVACFMCCNSPPNSTHVPCNGYLCNQAPHVGGVSCGVCDRVSDPKKCAVEQQCQPNEVCTVSTLFSGFAVKHSLGCEQKTVCDQLLKQFKITHTAAVGKRDVVLCKACCDGTGCNKDDCKNVIKRQTCHDSTICG
ncbi:Hypothetical predicted protein [Mytilus galloprovincialis]|uniref:Uncharacterized protein n=1 Tax=Mytilus galloprovincialis TaxID=29158 RepID=A0A8B6DZS6_MYTGA|nr:Hypothetical predicted protein [Mytilus galloprovincialis]